MPRRYEMSKRNAAREETRRRIVDATAKLHGERGVLGTTWQDIAKEADVAVSTVYAHFPTLEELLPACGQLVMERVRPPSADSASEILEGIDSTPDRLAAVARELFAFYERGGPHIEVDVRERELPGMREWESWQRRTVKSLVSAALQDAPGADRAIDLISAFFDLGTYKSLRSRGVGRDRAAETVADIALGLLDRVPRAEGGVA